MRTKWSQNFLIDQNIARKIVEGLALQKDESVIEIGPGRGILTSQLVQKAKRVIGVEIDPRWCGFLDQQFGKINGFKIIQGDFLELSLQEFSRISSGQFKVVGNLPYAVVSPMIQKILGWDQWICGVFMVQKEVAQRITARPGTKEYGILSITVQLRSRIKRVLNVSRQCFRPIPRVDSTVLRFDPLKSPFDNIEDENCFYATVRAAFAHRRKTIVNSLFRALHLPHTQIVNAVEKCGFSLTSRAEQFSVHEFMKLSQMLYNS